MVFIISHRGDLLRKEVSEKTEVGKTIEGKINRGEQVSDALITALVLGYIKRLVAINKSFSMDGYPQTLPQKKQLNNFANKNNIKIRYICVNVKPEVALDRMIHRVTCTACNTIFSNKNQTGENCIKCDGRLIVRKSDQEDMAKKRLGQFQLTTKIVMEEIEKYFDPIVIDGNKSVDTIQLDIIDSINSTNKNPGKQNVSSL